MFLGQLLILHEFPPLAVAGIQRKGSSWMPLYWTGYWDRATTEATYRKAAKTESCEYGDDDKCGVSIVWCVFFEYCISFSLSNFLMLLYSITCMHDRKDFFIARCIDIDSSGWRAGLKSLTGCSLCTPAIQCAAEATRAPVKLLLLC